ncbi:MAG: SH3 domain-containing protein [Thiolinea sp.]
MRCRIRSLPISANWSMLTLLVMLALLFPGAVLAERPLIAMDGQKIVTGSSVRFRVQPSLEAEIVGRVGLGAVVHATRRTKEKLQTGGLNSYWYFISASDKQGWISGSFLRDFKPEKREQIWFKIIRERMDNPELSFTDCVALYRFVNLVADKTDNKKMQSAFDLGRLLALQKAFDKVNWENAQHEPYLSWVKEHKEAKRVFHDEISGQWLVPSTDYWKLADAYKGRKGEDEISWYAANAQLGGECEGDIDCNLRRDVITQGEYLRRLPYGRYAGASLKRLSASLDYIQQALKQEPNYFRDFRTAGEPIETLFEIIASSNPKLTERAVAMKQIKAIRRVFDQR